MKKKSLIAAGLSGVLIVAGASAGTAAADTVAPDRASSNPAEELLPSDAVIEEEVRNDAETEIGDDLDAVDPAGASSPVTVAAGYERPVLDSAVVPSRVMGAVERSESTVRGAGGRFLRLDNGDGGVPL